MEIHAKVCSSCVLKERESQARQGKKAKIGGAEDPRGGSSGEKKAPRLWPPDRKRRDPAKTRRVESILSAFPGERRTDPRARREKRTTEAARRQKCSAGGPPEGGKGANLRSSPPRGERGANLRSSQPPHGGERGGTVCADGPFLPPKGHCRDKPTAGAATRQNQPTTNRARWRRWTERPRGGKRDRKRRPTTAAAAAEHRNNSDQQTKREAKKQGGAAAPGSEGPIRMARSARGPGEGGEDGAATKTGFLHATGAGAMKGGAAGRKRAAN